MGAKGIAEVHDRKGKVFAVSTSGAASTQDVEKRWRTGLDGFLSDPHCVLARKFGVDIVDDEGQLAGLLSQPAILFLRRRDGGAAEHVYFWKDTWPLYRPRLDDVWSRVVRPRLEGETVADDVAIPLMGVGSISIGKVGGALVRKFRHKHLDGDVLPEPESAGASSAAAAPAAAAAEEKEEEEEEDNGASD